MTAPLIIRQTSRELGESVSDIVQPVRCSWGGFMNGVLYRPPDFEQLEHDLLFSQT